MARSQELDSEVNELENKLTGEVIAAIAVLAVLMHENEDEEDDNGAALVLVLALPRAKRAIRTITRWLEQVGLLVTSFPIFLDEDAQALDITLDRLRKDVRLSHIWKDAKGRRQLIARMVWLIDWLKSLVEFLGNYDRRSGIQKTWISRLLPNTCSYCRKLHGVTIPIEESFREYAEEAGWERIYGSLMFPPLHPNCLCRLIYS